MSDLIESIRKRDPARPSTAEVIFAYPGFHAVGMHRVAHFLWSHKLKALARIWSHLGRLLTGIEIHPGAKIGKRLFIDHGMGVVIGETAEIGDDVTLYHNVTLGGKGGGLPGKRHPTLKNKVMVGAGAQILGAITLGEGAMVGAAALVTRDIPDHCTAVGNPARLVNCPHQKAAYGLPVQQSPDPVGETIDGILDDLEKIKTRLGMEEAEKDQQAAPEATYEELWKGSFI